MAEQIRISGYCPEIARGGSFDLESVLRISPRILKAEGDKILEEVGRVQGIKRGIVFRNSYTLKTSEEEVRLDFYRRDKDKLVFLGLPKNYCWGREVFEQQ